MGAAPYPRILSKLSTQWVEIICKEACLFKAEFTEEGTFFANRFPSLRTFVDENVKNRKKLSPLLLYQFENLYTWWS